MPNSTTILIVEDDPEAQELLRCALEGEGYKVFTASTGAEMNSKISKVNPDIVFLDLMLPDTNGIRLISEIQKSSLAKIIVISAKQKLTDKVVALEMGADDYITKPYEMEEVIARLHARIRRHKQLKKYQEQVAAHRPDSNSPARIKFGNWILDRNHWQAYDENGKSAELTPREFHILETLVMEGNRVLSRAQLLDKAWQDGNNTTDRAVDVQILRIRKKNERHRRRRKFNQGHSGRGIPVGSESRDGLLIKHPHPIRRIIQMLLLKKQKRFHLLKLR